MTTAAKLAALEREYAEKEERGEQVPQNAYEAPGLQASYTHISRRAGGQEGGREGGREGEGERDRGSVGEGRWRVGKRRGSECGREEGQRDRGTEGHGHGHGCC